MLQISKLYNNMAQRCGGNDLGTVEVGVGVGGIKQTNPQAPLSLHNLFGNEPPLAINMKKGRLCGEVNSV